jgi:hypothetical protein
MLHRKWHHYMRLVVSSRQLLLLLLGCKCSKCASNANNSRQLLKAIGRVDGLVTSDKEVHKLMLDREEAWRSRIMIKQDDSSCK